MIYSAFLATFGFMFVLVGLIVVFVAIVFLFFLSANGEKKVRGGGVIIVGLFPIVFGTDRRIVKVLFIVSIILVVFFLVRIVFSIL